MVQNYTLYMYASEDPLVSMGTSGSPSPRETVPITNAVCAGRPYRSTPPSSRAHPS